MLLVKPSKKQGKSHWLGRGMPLSFELSQAVAQALSDRPLPENLFSKRGAKRFEALRQEMAVTEPGSARLIEERDGMVVWWTFAGTLLNDAVAHALCRQGLKLGTFPF